MSQSSGRDEPTSGLDEPTSTLSRKLDDLQDIEGHEDMENIRYSDGSYLPEEVVSRRTGNEL